MLSHTRDDSSLIYIKKLTANSHSMSIQHASNKRVNYIINLCIHPIYLHILEKKNNNSMGANSAYNILRPRLHAYMKERLNNICGNYCRHTKSLSLLQIGRERDEVKEKMITYKYSQKSAVLKELKKLLLCFGSFIHSHRHVCKKTPFLLFNTLLIN